MENKKLYIELVTPEKKLFSGYALSVWFPGSLSPFQVLPNHAPIVSSLEAGLIKYLDEESKLNKLAITGGFVELKNNKVSVIIEKAMTKNDLTLEKANSMLDELKNKLSTAKTEEDKQKIKTELEFAKACLAVISDDY